MSWRVHILPYIEERPLYEQFHISVMTHPDNPWKPIWFTRDYGHLSPSPFNFLDEPWRLGKGKSINLKYRVALHVGTPKDADLDGVYRQWIKST